MLLPENIHPENSLYFNGAHVLRTLKQVGAMGVMDIYAETRVNTEMPIAIFSLTLDWLFLADLVIYDSNGNIQSCF